MSSTHNVCVSPPRPEGEGRRIPLSPETVRVEDIIGRSIGCAPNGCSYKREGHELLPMRMPWARIVDMFEWPNDNPDLAKVLGVPEGSPVAIVPAAVYGSVLRGVIVDTDTRENNRAEFHVTKAGRPSWLSLALERFCERRRGGGRLTRVAESVGRLLAGRSVPVGYVTVEFLGFDPDSGNIAALSSTATGQQLTESVSRDPNGGSGSGVISPIAEQHCHTPPPEMNSPTVREG